MKPFNLNFAIRGDPVVTKCGYPVELKWFDMGGYYQIGGRFKSPLGKWIVGSWAVNGKHSNSSESDLDLFMADKKYSVVLIAMPRPGHGEYGYVFNSKKAYQEATLNWMNPDYYEKPVEVKL